MTTENIISETGFLRVKDVLKIIPVSKSTWWEGVKTGRFPKSIKLGPRTTVWRVEDIKSYMEEQNSKAA